MIVYFIRHGETVWNKEGRLQGYKDSPLTKKGEESAKRIGDSLSKENIEIIYSSDLGRCVQTAEIINQRLKVKLIKTPELRERNFGDLNGQLNEKVNARLNSRDPNERAPHGESSSESKKRVLTFLWSLPDESQKTLLVTHDGPLRFILSEYYQVDFNSPQCEGAVDTIYVLEISDKRIKKGSLKLKVLK